MAQGNGIDVSSYNDTAPLGTLGEKLATARKDLKMKQKGNRAAVSQPAVTAASAEVAVAEQPVAQAPTTAPKARTPAEIIAAMRERRTANLAVKVEVSPEITEALELLNEERGRLNTQRSMYTEQILELKNNLGKNLVPDSQLRDGIRRLEAEIAGIDSDIAQIETDSKALVSDNGVAMMLAIVRQASMRVETRKILDSLRAIPSPDAHDITVAVTEAYEKVKVIRYGMIDQPHFRWGRDIYVSALPADPTAFGFIPIVKKIAEEYTQRVAARMGAIRSRTLGTDEIGDLRKTATSLSALLAGGEGHAFVPIFHEKGEKLGDVLVEVVGGKTLITKATTELVARWVFESKRDGMLQEPRPVKFRKDGSLEHFHPGIRSSFERAWDHEEPIRRRTEAIETVGVQIRSFTESNDGKVHNLAGESDLERLLKPRTGTGLWPLTFAYKVEPGRKGRVATCGIVLYKKGSKVSVAYATPELKKVLDKDETLGGEIGLGELPQSLSAMLRAACEHAGIPVPETLA